MRGAWQLAVLTLHTYFSRAPLFFFSFLPMPLDAELPCHGARAAEAEQGAACAKRFLASPWIKCGGGSD